MQEEIQRQNIMSEAQFRFRNKLSFIPEWHCAQREKMHKSDIR